MTSVGLLEGYHGDFYLLSCTIKYKVDTCVPHDVYCLDCVNDTLTQMGTTQTNIHTHTRVLVHTDTHTRG